MWWKPMIAEKVQFTYDMTFHFTFFKLPVKLDNRLWKFVRHMRRGKFIAPCLVSRCADGCFYSYVRDNHMWKCRVHMWQYVKVFSSHVKYSICATPICAKLVVPLYKLKKKMTRMDYCVFYGVRSLSLGGAAVLWGPGRGWWGMMGRGVQPEVTRSHYGGQEVELCTTTCGFVPAARQRSAGVTHASVAAQWALRRLRLSGLRTERKGRLSSPRVSVY